MAKLDDDPLGGGQDAELLSVTLEDIERYHTARRMLDRAKPPGSDQNALLPVAGSREEKQAALAIRDEMDRKAVAMRARRMSYVQISQALGLGHHEQARRAVQRGLVASATHESLLEQREVVLNHYDQMTQAVWEVMAANHLVVSNGRVVKLGDKPLRDHRPVLEAVDRLLQIERDRALVTGVRVPKQKEVVITGETVDGAIAALEARLGISGPAPHYSGGYAGREAPIEARILEEPAGAGTADDAGGAPGVSD